MTATVITANLTREAIADHGQQKFRRSKADIDRLKAEITNILEGDRPMTVRQVFYQLVVRRCIEKTEQDYKGATAMPSKV